MELEYRQAEAVVYWRKHQTTVPVSYGRSQTIWDSPTEQRRNSEYMALAVEAITVGTATQQNQPTTVQNGRRSRAHRRLTKVFNSAKRVPFDDSSRIVFFSDCHRGNNGRADEFAKNAALFLHALTHYYREGFTYVEVGDGDDLWKHRRFGDIRRAHSRVFDLLHRFDRLGRLHLIVGNHDIQGRRRDRVEKDGIATHEGLVLRHSRTRQRIFVVHGHQADFKSDQLHFVSRFVVRYIWKLLQFLGFENETGREGINQRQKGIDRRIIDWVRTHGSAIICGHTHRPVCPSNGGVPYFNTGSCLLPGILTGLEIQDGTIAPIRWTSTSARHRNGAVREVGARQLIAPPTRLHDLSSLAAWGEC